MLAAWMALPIGSCLQQPLDDEALEINVGHVRRIKLQSAGERRKVVQEHLMKAH